MTQGAPRPDVYLQQIINVININASALLNTMTLGKEFLYNEFRMEKAVGSLCAVEPR